MGRRLEDAADSLARRVLWAVGIASFARWVTILAFVLGTLALFARRFGGLEPREAALVLAPLALAPLLGLRDARRSAIPRDRAAAWLDVRSGGSGLLLTELELADERWSRRSEALVPTERGWPRVRLGRPLALAAFALLYATLSLAVAVPRSLDARAPISTAAIERVEERLAALEEEVALEPELAAELHEGLDRLAEERGEAGAESVLEALDAIDRRIGAEAERAAEATRGAQGALAAASAEHDAEAAQRELEATLGGLSRAGLTKNFPAALSARLAPESLALPAGLRLDPAELEALGGEPARALDAKLASLAKAGLTAPRELAAPGKLAKLDGFEYREAPAHACEGGTCPEGEPCRGGKCEGCGVCAGTKPGRGGVSRGRGDAELSFGEEPPEQTARFEPKALEPARWLDSEHSAVLGVSADAPEVAPIAGAAGLVETAPAAAKAAWRRRLAPRHRAAVESFFSTAGSAR